MMSAVDIALLRLQTEEGFRSSVYRDTQGHQTIGYGFNIDAGLSKYAAGVLLQAQAQECHEKLLAYPWYAALNDVRQSVLLDMAFNMGLAGLLHYPAMIAALQSGNWSEAAAQCHVAQSDVDGSRYKVLRQLLLTGEP